MGDFLERNRGKKVDDFRISFTVMKTKLLLIIFLLSISNDERACYLEARHE